MSASEKRLSLGYVFWVKAPGVFVSVMIVAHLSNFFLEKIGVDIQYRLLTYYMLWGIASLSAAYLIWSASKFGKRAIYKYLSQIISIFYAGIFFYSFLLFLF
ncbi:hypothetical protein [Sedimenticola hydrogenitrophicus]|uniref:hypothetical protein n=1 Tax=Sedimenticola hydrogenitrophicus TaxID=2967975 RepID=UPI0023B13973|nr:hypothetical protein [Sedimenticola hydrogenitrophicus]